MQFPEEKPDLTSLEEYIDFEAEYIKDNKKVYFDKIEESEDSAFSLFLKIEDQETGDNTSIRIAIERHPKVQTHYMPHLDLKVQNVKIEFFKSGALYVVLLVDNIQELENCCLGFASIMYNTIPYIAEYFNVDESEIKEILFTDLINELDDYHKNLHDVILKAFNEEKILLEPKESTETVLIQIKRKKTEDITSLSKFKKAIIIAKIIQTNTIFKPLLYHPLVSHLASIPGLSHLSNQADVHNKFLDYLLETEKKFEQINEDQYKEKLKIFIETKKS